MTTIANLAQEWQRDLFVVARQLGNEFGFPEVDVFAEEPPIFAQMLADPRFFPLPAEELSEQYAPEREQLISHEAQLRAGTEPWDRVTQLYYELTSEVHPEWESLEAAVEEYAQARMVEMFATMAQSKAQVELAKMVLESHHMVVRMATVHCACLKWRAISLDPHVQSAEFRTHMREVVADFLHDFPDAELPMELEAYRPIKVVNPSPANWTPITNTSGIPVLVPANVLLPPEKENRREDDRDAAGAEPGHGPADVQPQAADLPAREGNEPQAG